MKKVFWFDVETTGTDPKIHGIIEFAGLIEINGKVVDQLSIKMQTHSGAVIEQSALEVTGVTEKDIQGYMPHVRACRMIQSFLDKHCAKFNKSDKLYPAGFNVRFDLDFLQVMFKKMDKYGLGSYLNWRAIDPLPLLRMMDYAGKIDLPDYKLSTVCAHYGIDIKAHEALSDIQATRELTLKLIGEVMS